MHDVVRGQRSEIGDVPRHGRIQALDVRTVPGVEVDIPRDEDERAVPRGTGTPVVAPGGAGHDARELTVRALAVHHAVQPLAVGGLDIEIPEPELGRELGVAGPAVLLAMRTVGGNPHEVAAIGPLRATLQTVERLVRTVKPADLDEVGVHHAPAQVVESRLAGQSLDTHVLKPVVGKVGLPDFLALPLQDIAVGLALPAFDEAVDVALIDVTVRREFLGIPEHHLGAGGPTGTQLRPAGHVLPQIVDGRA